MTRDRIATRINAWFDGVPRTRLFRGARTRPAFRSCGTAAICAASIVAVGAGLRARVELSILALLIAACAASFLALALVRRALTGREQLVLLEHLWLALATAGGVASWLGEPVFPYLDVIAVGLCAFLAVGRLGCLLVGCCHGVPASAGIVYPRSSVEDGFAAHLAGVRLFPVQAVEAAGWLLIGAAGWLVIPASPPGLVTVWVLAAYAILRFGLEALRGDARPTVLGLSQARWMAAVQLAAVLPLAEVVDGRAPAPRTIAIAAAIVVGVAIAGALRHLTGPRRRLLRAAHVAELRAHVRALAERQGTALEVMRTRAGASVGVSREEGPDGPALHVSCMLPRDTRDLKLLCELTAAALPELELASARIGPEALLHVRVPAALEPGAPDRSTAAAVGDALHGCVLRRHQGADASACPEPGFAPDVRFDRIRVHADARYHRWSENRQDASVASPGKRLPTATPGTG